jgi:uncharacterized protein (DUF58 family)
MRLTRRGWVALVVAIGGLAIGVLTGARAVNALVAPAGVVLVTALALLATRSEPSVSWGDPRPGFPGETRTVSLSIEGRGLARIADTADAPTTQRSVTLPATLSVEYRLLQRGAYALGPPRIVVTDPFGLIERAWTPDATVSGLVYPAVYDAWHVDGLAHVLGRLGARDPLDFEYLREYTPGDSLRDVHWKKSATRPAKPVVKEFVHDSRDHPDVTIAGTAAAGAGDAMASGVATLALALLDEGVPVGIDVPTGHLAPSSGSAHRTALLSLLARTESGGLDAGATGAADLHVHADGDGVSLRSEGLLDERVDLPAETPDDDASVAVAGVSA